jgi:hypothetical protein
MKLFIAVITDYKGEAVEELTWRGSSKHAAYDATEFIKQVPPAMDFYIRPIFLTNHEVAEMFNKELQGNL